jgi:hypothetical protein
MPIGRLALLVVFAAASSHASASPPCRSPLAAAPRRTAPPHVRSTDAIVLAALARGRARSETFRGLVDRLEASDVIVHVERRQGGRRPSGFTQFIAATRHVRSLRITLAADEASDATAALLGHELRHALEIAQAPAVIDESSYREHYREIGQASCGPPHWCVDTAAAVHAGARMYAELRAGRRSARLAAAQNHERRGND